MRTFIECGPCTVRSWRSGDEASLPHHANNRKVWINLRDRFPHPYTPEDAAAYIQHVLSRDPETSFAIDVKGEAVGGVSLMRHTDVERFSAEIGYWLGEDHWGRGIATAAIRGVTRHALELLDMDRVFAVPFAPNAASIRALEKAGYVREGVMRRSAVKDGRVLDQVMYSLVRADLGLPPRS